MKLELLLAMIRQEHPEFSEEEVEFQGRRLRRELQRLARSWSRSQARFRAFLLAGRDPQRRDKDSDSG